MSPTSESYTWTAPSASAGLALLARTATSHGATAGGQLRPLSSCMWLAMAPTSRAHADAVAAHLQRDHLRLPVVERPASSSRRAAVGRGPRHLDTRASSGTE